MNLIHERWGSTFTFGDPLEFFKQEPSYWRNLLYSRKLLVFKNMNFTKEDYVKFCSHFGKMWSGKDYAYSREAVESIKVNNLFFTLSPISNKISKRLGIGEMDWHADIPNRVEKPFPIRSLWMVNNPNPDAGITTWMNIEEGIEYLPKHLKEQIDNISIIQQSWYEKDTDIQEFDFKKIHPITNKTSLRLNYFCDEDRDIVDAWIKEVKMYGEKTSCKKVLGPFLKYLSSVEDCIYSHKWGLNDIVIYDNWPFVHNRTNLEISDDQERKFYRCNIDHLTDKEFVNYQDLIKKFIL